MWPLTVAAFDILVRCLLFRRWISCSHALADGNLSAYFRPIIYGSCSVIHLLSSSSLLMLWVLLPFGFPYLLRLDQTIIECLRRTNICWPALVRIFIYYFARGSGCEVLWWVRLCVRMCLSVCPREYLRNHTSDLYPFCACCHGWVLLQRRCDTLCTSGFVDDIRFSFYNGPYSGMNFARKDRLCLSLLIYRNVGQNSIPYY